MSGLLDIRPEVAAALGQGRPVVALETSLIAHGLPAPQNLATARAMERAVGKAGAVPATIGLIDGKVVVGLNDQEIGRFATEPGIAKASLRDLAPLLARGGTGVPSPAHAPAPAWPSRAAGACSWPISPCSNTTPAWPAASRRPPPGYRAASRQVASASASARMSAK